MGERELRVYCAGPLFNDKEREEMEQIASELEEEGFDTFLPQRDGLVLSECLGALHRIGVPRERAHSLMSQAIFALDVYQVLIACQATVVNLNGRVPDEGAVAEAAMAWSAGKTLVGYKADSRSVLGGEDNPLVAGLFQFKLAPTIRDAVEELRKASDEGRIGAKEQFAHEEALRGWLEAGKQLSDALGRGRDLDSVAALVLREFSEQAAV